MAIVAALCCMACEPHRADFKYIDLSKSGLTATMSRKPDLGLYFGDEIPEYETVLAGSVISITDDLKEPFVPGLKISKSPTDGIPLRITDVRLDCFSTVGNERSDCIKYVLFSCSKVVDNLVSLSVQVGDSEPLNIRGTVRKAGSFSYWDGL